MRRIRSKGMKPELDVRRLVHGLGYRYRLHVRSLPGKPDLVFRLRRKVILVHGCFWHQHPNRRCKIVRRPKSNKTYWTRKLKNNAARDLKHLAALRKDGWRVLVIWECQTANLATLAERITTFLGSAKTSKSGASHYQVSSRRRATGRGLSDVRRVR